VQSNVDGRISGRIFNHPSFKTNLFVLQNQVSTMFQTVHTTFPRIGVIPFMVLSVFIVVISDYHFSVLALPRIRPEAPSGQISLWGGYRWSVVPVTIALDSWPFHINEGGLR